MFDYAEIYNDKLITGRNFTPDLKKVRQPQKNIKYKKIRILKKIKQKINC